MIDNKNYLTMIAVGMTDNKTLQEARWGKVKKTAKAVYDRMYVDYILTEDDLP